MNSKDQYHLSEEQIDKIVMAEVNNETAWDEPIEVYISEKAISLPPELAKRAAFFAKLHNKSTVEEWLQSIIQERIQFEEAAFADIKHAMRK